MADLSRPVPGPQPGPEPNAPILAAGPAAASDRRRAASRPTPVSEAERRTADENILIELRRKVQSGELLSASTERLLWKMKFNGHLTVVVNNGRVVKSAYEEGYFRRRNDLGGVLLDV
jgi:sulfur carrier protein ThiS